MKVGDLMTRNVRACHSASSLAEAAQTMKEVPCGFLPVRDAKGRVAGVITDRDICMAAARIDRPARAIPVREAMTMEVLTCSMDEDVLDAVRRMQLGHVHRLPVVSREGELEGVVSIDDVIDRAGEAWEQPISGVSLGEVVPVLRALHERIVRRAAWEGRTNETDRQFDSTGPARVRGEREH